MPSPAQRSPSMRSAQSRPRLAQAPSRVELLGNHTDYNGGLVLAAAIDRFTVVAGRPGADRSARVRSVNFDQSDEFDLAGSEPGEPGSWGRYVRGVVWALQEAYGPLSSGFDAAIVGDVPLGAGLSSSASLQAAVAAFLSRTVGCSPLVEREHDDADAACRSPRSSSCIRKRVRWRRIGVARPVLRPFRPRGPRAPARLPEPGVRTDSVRSRRKCSPRDRHLRLKNLAASGRRNVQPAQGRVRAASSSTSRPSCADSMRSTRFAT